MNEPYWKLALNWGAVITFLMLPLVIMVIQLYVLSHPMWIPNPEKYAEHFHHLSEFQRNLTVLVFGLAGLRTWETIKNGKEHNENRHQ
jgi:hypothetical protein